MLLSILGYFAIGYVGFSIMCMIFIGYKCLTAPIIENHP